jgi:putative SOS response-associated peptidase YedK
MGMRCLVPADAFCGYQDGPSPKAKRWFARPDGKPFFFAGTWAAWEGTRGTKKNPVVGKHELFTILTTSPNEIVKPVHRKAMPAGYGGGLETRIQRSPSPAALTLAAG